MDELTLFRNTRNENRQPSEHALAAGRDALLARATAGPGLADTTVPVHEAETPGRTSLLRGSVPAPRWAAAAIAVALTVLVVWVLVPALGLGGNASRPASIVPSPSTSAVMPPQVTRETYEAAYAEFAQCMKDNGVGLGAEQMEGLIHQYTYLASQESLYLECYADFQQIEAAWQIANQYDSPTYVALRNCLTQIGVQPDADAEGVWQQVQEHNIDPAECTLGVTTPPEE